MGEFDFWAVDGQSAAGYLKHRYEIPKEMPRLPLADEPFVAEWEETVGHGVLDFLSDRFGLPVADFSWKNITAAAPLPSRGGAGGGVCNYP